MRSPLARHPSASQLVVVLIGLPVVVTLAVLAFAWPAARIQPRDLPVGIVGSTAGSQQALSQLGSVAPGAFDFRLYPDEAGARSAIEHRIVYGAVEVAPTRVELLTASAAGPAVAQALTGVADRLAAGRPLDVVDVVPLSAADARGSVFSSALLPLTICGIAIAAAVGLVFRIRPAWRQILTLAGASAVAAAGVYLIAQPFLGVLPGSGVADSAGLALTLFAISAGAAGLIALLGIPGLGLAAALIVFVGNPFSGVTSAPELLPDAARHLGQWLPPGAGASLLRGTAYFDGHGAGPHLGVLVTWVVLGCVAVLAGRQASSPVAARPAGESGSPLATIPAVRVPG